MYKKIIISGILLALSFTVTAYLIQETSFDGIEYTTEVKDDNNKFATSTFSSIELAEKAYREDSYNTEITRRLDKIILLLQILNEKR